MTIESLQQTFLIYSLSLPRMMGCFIMLPILGKQMLGSALLRNGILCSLVLFIQPILHTIPLPEEISAIWLGGILAKEVMLGVLIGFLAAIPFWAIEACGFLIDNQRGAAMASVFNPTLGQQSTPTGLLFSQILITLFFVSGSFLAFLHAMYLSYLHWPVLTFIPSTSDAWVSFFYSQFEQIFKLCLLMASPIVIAMFIAEFGLALVSRFAPQLNVFSLAMPIKSGVSSLLLVVYVSMMMNSYSSELTAISTFMEMLTPVIGG